MRLTHHARAAAAATAVVCASSLIATSSSAVAAKDPSQESRKFRKAVTPGGIGLHLDALQNIAAANNGNRASGTPGYNASRRYVVRKLRAAGYKPTIQTFQFPFFKEDAPSTLAQTAPDATTYAQDDDFEIMTGSGSGNVTDAAVVVVDNDLTPADPTDVNKNSGCEAEDFAAFPEGAIALMQRGTCAFGVKAANAEEAGASAALIFNNGTNDANGDRTGTVLGTLDGVVANIPVLGLSFAAGVDLGTPSNTRASVSSDTTNETRTTYNVIADTKKGNADRVVMAGAHLDSVEEGPGINDNGSGSATVLEMAEEMAKVKKLRNKVRFAWWGAEEFGLLGAQHYVDDLATNPEALDEIGAYLNFDMVGSPNYVRFVYDGDNSLGEDLPVPAPAGSGDIEQLFAKYFTNQRLESEETAFDGRSDYGPFIENGVPAGGLFTGAEDVKTAAQARTYGGVAGVAYDPCYHAACDDRDNISVKALNEMSDAAAHVTYVLAQNTGLVQAKAKAKKSAALTAEKKAGKGNVMAGHLALR